MDKNKSCCVVKGSKFGVPKECSVDRDYIIELQQMKRCCAHTACIFILLTQK